uniref:Uncharacterized protein n=1 Tax=Kalanchoe fedtschenkoi TaxID=63787 RepID=A0A7N0T6N2_KALFE
MASLTPGVLSKLLQHAGDSTFKALGQHRTPLLQVIEIVPALSADDPWRTRGFYLKLSDSEHSAYASVPDDDVDLIYGDKIQLGQFVHISRLDSGKPVPVIRGIKPLPRRRPCVGTPKDLISSDLLQPRKKKGGLALHELKCPRRSLEGGKRQVLDDVLKHPRGECLGAGRRLSLDSARRGWDHHPPSTPRSTIAAQSSSSRLKSASETPRRASLVASFEKKHVSSCTPSPVASDNKPSRPVVASIAKNASGISSLQSKDKILINDSKPPVTKVLLSDRLDRNILWDSLPTKIRELGKGAVSHRDVAILIASRALEEASAMDGIVGCMRFDLASFAYHCFLLGLVPSTLKLDSFRCHFSSVTLLRYQNCHHN